MEEIDTFVNNQTKRHGIPGLALALVDGDKVIFMKGYGKADQTGRPITPQTPFILASVSKPLTVVAIMQLVDAGQVELDVPVQKSLPEFRVADPIAIESDHGASSSAPHQRNPCHGLRHKNKRSNN